MAGRKQFKVAVSKDNHVFASAHFITSRHRARRARHTTARRSWSKAGSIPKRTTWWTSRS